MLLHTIVFVCLEVFVIPIHPPVLPTNWLPTPCHVSSLVIPPTTRDSAILIPLHTMPFTLIILFFTNIIFLLLLPNHLLYLILLISFWIIPYLLYLPPLPLCLPHQCRLPHLCRRLPQPLPHHPRLLQAAMPVTHHYATRAQAGHLLQPLFEHHLSLATESTVISPIPKSYRLLSRIRIGVPPCKRNIRLSLITEHGLLFLHHQVLI